MSEYVFYSAFPCTRPIYQSEATRRFAWDSLHAVYGRDAMETPCVTLDGISDFENLTSYDKYDAAVTEIARHAPLRFCRGELICGAATLGDATSHVLPARYHGEIVLQSVSHLTCGFDRALAEGVSSYERRIAERMTRPCDAGQLRFLQSLSNVCTALHIWHARYLAALRELIAAADGGERRYYAELYENLERVPFEAPRSFREGVQALWFLFDFTRLCGNWPGIGRVDLMLGGLYERDLAAGRITYEAARELIAHFFIKGCEWIRLDSRGSGDAQHYQNIVLSGCDGEGKDITNDVTYMILDTVEEFPISDFPIAVRINENSDPKLYAAISRVMRHGSGVCAVYNERLIIDSLAEFGYPAEVARTFANDGCWEIQIPGKTCFTYHPIDMYA
ncbi:MAG: pyruvate formate lyase family protein, partial [Eubacteriales bacterium]